MSTPVFTGLGAVAFKYYMLFQHQSVVAETEKSEPSWVLGAHPGPYIKEQSRSVFMFLGRQVAFLGLDCRTERQRNEVITEDSYDVIFDRLEDEIIKGETKHLIVLLGVPIAYPRLNFLENILTSRLMDPIKALGRTGMLGNFVNKFDGGVEILDDLDDHWTAKHHKDERNMFIRELQHIASIKSVRVTILGGDVHLGAVGQFYTNKKLNIPKDKDHRYMPNVVSSAIVNTPPPEMMADILNKRNKVHHLDPFTDEDMIPLFTHDTDMKKRNNTHLLPRRNWCSLREYKPGTTPPSTPSPPPSPGANGPRLTRTLSDYTPGNMVRRMSSSGRRGRERGPPMAYFNNPAYAAADEEQAGVQSSFSPERSERPRSRRHSITSLFRRRASVDSVNPPGSSYSIAHSMPMPRDRTSFSRDQSGSKERPSPFHRRPSVLKNKSHKREGEYINLEGGLHVSLNLEVSQHDPSGITQPYHLLVPALDYTAPEAGTIEKARRKSRIGSMFGVFGGGGGRHNRTIGDDGQSMSGSEVDEQSDASSQLGEVDDEQSARQRYKVGPRILIPGLSRKRSRPTSASHANPPAPLEQDRRASQPQPQTQHRNHRQSVDYSPTASGAELGQDRRVSAPVTSYNMPTQTRALPQHTISRQLTHNSSHKSQLPEPDSKVHRRSMGGILNQHGDKHFEHDAHVQAHTPHHKKRESYPPHPAIVGAGPGSPYSRGGVEARDDAGGYFASAGRNGAYAPGPPAGVGAKYLGGGRYEDEDDFSDEDDDRSLSVDEKLSQDSFVPPKPKPKWKIWR
jgi:hypothetical protein